LILPIKNFRWNGQPSRSADAMVSGERTFDEIGPSRSDGRSVIVLIESKSVTDEQELPEVLRSLLDEQIRCDCVVCHCHTLREKGGTRFDVFRPRHAPQRCKLIIQLW